MLPTDMALLKNEETRGYVTEYAQDNGAFFRDFAASFKKLIELGHADNALYYPTTDKVEV